MDNKFSIPGEESCLTALNFDSAVSHDASGEYALPDYMPPIRRVVALRSTVLPEGKFLSPSSGGINVEFAGTVAHSLIYTDEEGRLCSTSLSADYGSNLVLPADTDYVRIHTAVESNNCRVLSPRKLNIRSRLRTSVGAFGNVPLQEKVMGVLTPADEIMIRRLPVEYQFARCLHGESKSLRTDGVIEFSGNRMRKPVFCDGDLVLREVKATDGGVNVRGMITVECLCVTDGEDAVPEKPEKIAKTVEFEERIEVPGVSAGDLATAVGRCVSLVINTEETPSGEREMSFEMTFDLEADAVRNQTASASADLYSTEKKMECTYRENESLYAERAWMTSLTVSESVARKETGIPQTVDVSASASVDRYEVKDGKLILNGTVAFNVITCNEDVEFAGEDHRVPFRYECDCTATGGCVCHCVCHCTSESARYEEGKVTLGAELFISAAVYGKTSFSTVDTIQPGEAFPEKACACIRAYYPSREESLWQISKKYHRNWREVAEENGISVSDVSAPLKGVKKLIV